MAKKIKLTEAQIQMLQKLESAKPHKVLKVTKEQYDRLFNTIDENEKLTGHPVAGDGGSEYNPQTEKENELTTQTFNESISEDVNTIISLQEFATHLLQFFKHFVNDPSQAGLDPFWKKMGVTWGDFKLALITVGFAVPLMIGGVESIKLVNKSDFMMALKKGGLKALYFALTGEKYKKPVKGESISLGDDLEIVEAGDGAYPTGSDNDPMAPWNRNDDEYEGDEETQFLEPEKIVLPLIYYNPNEDGVSVFKHNDTLLVFVSAYFDGSELEQYGNFPSPKRNEEAANDEARIIQNFINDALLKGKIKPKKYNDKFYETNYLTIVDDNVKAFCQKVYHDDAKLMNVLGGVSETTTAGSVGGAYVTPKMWANSPSDMKFGKSPMYRQGKIVEDGNGSSSRFAVEMDLYVFAENEKQATAQLAQIIKLLDRKLPDSRARVMKMKAMPFGAVGESVERKGQVEFDDCTKLNNNKEAQNGGCSVGAVDGVVKVKEELYAEVAKKTGRTVSEIKTIIESNINK